MSLALKTSVRIGYNGREATVLIAGLGATGFVHEVFLVLQETPHAWKSSCRYSGLTGVSSLRRRKGPSAATSEARSARYEQ